MWTLLLLFAAGALAKDLKGLERCEGGEFFESGPLKDEEISLGSGGRGRRVYLKHGPVRLFGRDHYSVFISPEGVIGMGSFSEWTQKGAEFPWDQAFVAPLWSGQADYNHGSVFFRESQERLILDRADRQLDYQGFKRNGNSRIRTNSVFIVTFLDLKDDAWRGDEGQSFQVAFYLTNAGTYANFIFGNIDEGSIRDHEGAISAGNSRQFYRFPFKGNRGKLLSVFGTTSTKGNWLFRVDESSAISTCNPHARLVDICSTAHSNTHDSYCEPRKMQSLRSMSSSQCRRECEKVLNCPAKKKKSTWSPRWLRRSPVQRTQKTFSNWRRSWQQG